MDISCSFSFPLNLPVQPLVIMPFLRFFTAFNRKKPGIKLAKLWNQELVLVKLFSDKKIL